MAKEFESNPNRFGVGRIREVKKQLKGAVKLEIYFSLIENIGPTWVESFIYRNFAGGEAIFSHGDHYEFYHVLIRGFAISSIQDVNGVEIPFYINHSGDMLEIANFQQSLHMCSSYAQTDSLVGLINREEAGLLIDDRPELLNMVILNIKRKLDFHNRVIMAKTTGGAKAAILFVLRYCASYLPEDESRIRISEVELGRLVGIRRATTSRIISQLRKIGLVEAVHGQLFIKDQDKLFRAND